MRIVRLEQHAATEHAIAGGKGANLGQLVAADFDVPPGFVVTSDAYRSFIEESGLAVKIGKLLGSVNYDNFSEMEALTLSIRQLFDKTVFPTDLSAEIVGAYSVIGVDALVAVRSSGTAEDLAGASFAGLHDTYLDVLGSDEVLDAVKRCWASLWTARATIYRHNNGFDHLQALMAVVVQKMVQSEVSGVMFTGNPLTAATDEIVINASWGLGEAVVQGIVSPDQYTVASWNLQIIERTLGTKAVEIIRNPAKGWGVVEQEVSAAKRGLWALSEEQVTALSRLGKRVQAHYGAIPQDIEWGLADGKLYLLQSRPITGVDFSWDAECSSWQPEELNPHAVWTRVPMDDLWTGAITPLMFSSRGESWAGDMRTGSVPILGCYEIAKIRAMKYFRGEAYQNVEVDRAWTKAALPAARPSMALKLPENMREEAINAPFSYFGYLKMYLRAMRLDPAVATPYGWMKSLQHIIDHRVEEATGLPDTELPSLSDDELKCYIRKQLDFEHEFNHVCLWPGNCLYSRDIMTILGLIVYKWYDGDNSSAFSELVAGSPNTSKTVREHIQLHEMGKQVRQSSRLSADFATLRDKVFFDSLQDSDEGRQLGVLVKEFLNQSGHRGHADRDIYYPRYADDAGVLYRALQAHVKADDDPLLREQENSRRRMAAIKDVEDNIRRKSFGFLKVKAFRWCLQYVLEFQHWRDDLRHFIDRNTYSYRKAFLEVGRRLVERGALKTEHDFWFLTKEELYELLDGAANVTLARAKIESRRRNFDAFNRKDYLPPKFLYRDRERSEPSSNDQSINGQLVLSGVPTSRGIVTGTARLVKQLSQIERVNRGEILIANSTDPGWTPVFALIKGVVVETGGLLSHSSCLAREYGFPATQIEGALRLIPDGATITVNGDTGEVRIHSEPHEDDTTCLNHHL